MTPITLPSPTAALSCETRTMTESAFLDYALSHLQEYPLACFLDSAGPLHERSKTMLLSGEPAGIFIQAYDRWEFQSAEGGQSVSMDREEFSTWVSSFQSLNLGAGGPLLFPMLSYEAFIETSRANEHHPIWPEVDAIWLLTHNSYTYNRSNQTLISPNPISKPEPFVLVQDPPWPDAEDARKGWRENQTSYSNKIHEVKRDIYEGNYYQANLSSRFFGTTHQDPLATYRRMRAMNPSPFMGIFRWGPLWVLSGSPERLLSKEGNTISTRPIAGTQPRFTDPLADAASIRQLTSSEKEKAEHLMLVDLARNDLGKIASPGTVHVPEFAQIESYSHVHHLVSQVEAQIQPGISPIDAIAALFPGGTITGAPKIACMEKLAQLEGEARGPYTGSFGYLDSRGNMDLNILIRTLIQRENRICFHAGGGIVADSEQNAEYLETRHKAAALMEALALRV